MDNIADLKDIVLPQAPANWPPATGMWILIAMVGLLLFALGRRIRQKRKRNAYRHAGLKLLEDAQSAYDISVVLKRVALAVFPREEVASLYGNDWADFLAGTCPGHDFSLVAAHDPDRQPIQELSGLARTWILNHRIPENCSD